MKSLQDKRVLVAGASIAGLSTAYWMNQLGYHVTVVELARSPRLGGAAVNVQGGALDAAKRMGIFEQLKAHKLNLELWEFKNADDDTVGSIVMNGEDNPTSNADDDIKEIEIERDKLINILLAAVKDDVEFIFGESIAALDETSNALDVTFKSGAQRAFDLVFGCDGLHSSVRRICFGHESDHIHSLNYYFSLTIVNKLLISQNTAQIYNVPDKVIMLNAYNNKTDIAFCFFSDEEISYDYRNAEQQKQIIREQFAGESWRSAELLEEVERAGTAYFDKFCQVTMPSWTKGRVALVGDAAYCASPAAGSGASLAMEGATVLADALQQHDGDVEAAFADYNRNLRPFIEEVQAGAIVMLGDYLVPKTEEAIHKRNTQPGPF